MRFTLPGPQRQGPGTGSGAVGAAARSVRANHRTAPLVQRALTRACQRFYPTRAAEGPLWVGSPRAWCTRRKARRLCRAAGHFAARRPAHCPLPGATSLRPVVCAPTRHRQCTPARTSEHMPPTAPPPHPRGARTRRHGAAEGARRTCALRRAGPLLLLPPFALPPPAGVTTSPRSAAGQSDTLRARGGRAAAARGGSARHCGCAGTRELT